MYEQKIASYEADVKRHKTQAEELIDVALKGGRINLTPEEQDQVDYHIEQAKAANEGLKKAQADARMIDQIKNLGGDTEAARKGLPKELWAAKTVKDMQNARYGQKTSLVAAGTVLTSVPAPDAHEAGRPVPSVLSIIPREKADGRIAYMQETTRSHAATVVAQQTLKPKSTYLATRVDQDPSIIAHLAGPYSKYDLEDSQALQGLLQRNMAEGLDLATQSEILAGSGTAPHFRGLANLSGIRTQAWSTDMLTTTRKALGQLEGAGYNASAWIISADDWMALELSTLDGTGEFALNQGGGNTIPVESATRRLWGVPVAVSPVLAAGTAYVGDFAGSTKLYVIDQMELEFDTGMVGSVASHTAFETNEVFVRAEYRATFACYRTDAFVKVTTASG